MANKSKQKRLRRENESILAVKQIDKTNSNADEISGDTRKGWWFGLSSQSKLLTIGIIALLSLGTLGAGLKYLDDDARRELAKRNTSTPLNPVEDQSLLSSVNPFLPAPPTATPQLSKELNICRQSARRCRGRKCQCRSARRFSDLATFNRRVVGNERTRLATSFCFVGNKWRQRSSRRLRRRRQNRFCRFSSFGGSVVFATKHGGISRHLLWSIK